jgi:hypothetical protein
LNKTANFISIAEIVDVQNPDGSDYKHPLLTMAKFIFADDRGNNNRQGIKAEDFDEVIKSAIDTPVKMRFLGANVAGHPGSVPIGHIKRMEKESETDVNRLVAWAVLYSEEFPDEINFLKEAHASGEGPGISYEIMYSNSVSENGIEWLKNMTTRAATFVKSPAYGTRTALLALASNKDISPEEFTKELLAIVKPNDKGGSQRMELEDKIKALEAEKASLTAEASTKQSEIDKLAGEITTLKTEVDTLKTQNSDLKRTAVADARAREYVEAGFQLEADAEKLTKKKEFWTALSDEAWTEYLTDLKSAKATTPAALASASARGTSIPKLAVAEGKETTLDDLKAGLRGISRGQAVASE